MGGDASFRDPSRRGCGGLRRRARNNSSQLNTTRFLAIGRPGEPAPRVAGADYKTSVLLVLPDTPGSLFHVLGPLSAAGINLTKIESRPSRRRAWDYVFFLDLDGHAGDPNIAPVLAQLEATCQLFKVLGTYRKADAR